MRKMFLLRSWFAVAIVVVGTTKLIAAPPQSVVTADLHRVAAPASPNVDITTGNSTTSSFRIFNSLNMEIARVTAGGRVGIGTNLPDAQLHLLSTDTSFPRTLLIDQFSSDNRSPLIITRTKFLTPSRLRFQIDAPVSIDNVPTAVTFTTGVAAEVERMRITSGGKVGIGTSVPSTRSTSVERCPLALATRRRRAFQSTD
jgi:hypothetical protein